MEENVLPGRKNNRSIKKQKTHQDKKVEIITEPSEFDVQEVETVSDKNIEKGGTIKPWERLEIQEKLKMRAFLTYSTVLLWLSWTTIGLIDYLIAGNPFLLVTSPPIGGLLLLIFKFYFK